MKHLRIAVALMLCLSPLAEAKPRHARHPAHHTSRPRPPALPSAEVILAEVPERPNQRHLAPACPCREYNIPTTSTLYPGMIFRVDIDECFPNLKYYVHGPELLGRLVPLNDDEARMIAESIKDAASTPVS